MKFTNLFFILNIFTIVSVNLYSATRVEINKELEIIERYVKIINEDKNHPSKDFLLTKLFNAIESENIELVKFAVNQGFDINTRSFITNDTLLSTAAYKGNIDLVNFLLDNDKNFTSPKGCKALLNAILSRNKEIIEILLNKGVNINEWIEGCDITPLEAAFQLNNEDIASFLISKGVNINQNSLLIIAIRKSHAELVKLLFENGLLIDDSIISKAIEENNQTIDRWEKLLPSYDSIERIDHINNKIKIAKEIKQLLENEIPRRKELIAKRQKETAKILGQSLPVKDVARLISEFATYEYEDLPVDERKIDINK